MSSPQSNVSLKRSGPAETDDRATLSAIDDAVRGPALVFLFCAIGWLLLGTLLALVASIQEHSPGFLAGEVWLTFGRIQPASVHALIYGWAMNAGIAVSFWLMARLGGAQLRHSGILYVAALFWNAGVAVGLGGIFIGDLTGFAWLEFPRYATPLLFASYVLTAVWGVLTFGFRRRKPTFVSQWYLLGAYFWFPWIFSVAQLLLVFAPVTGVAQVVTQAWYTQNLLGLWFAPIGLAAAYYFIPKILGRPIHIYHFCIAGFWSLAVFSNLAGGRFLIGGPVPVWVQSVGIVASMALLFPVVVIGINLYGTLAGCASRVWQSPTLRFVVFGVVNFTIATAVYAVMSLRTFDEVTHLTEFHAANIFQQTYAFFAMVIFGSIYYIVPRLLRKEWPSSFLINVHFWTVAVGIVMQVLALSIGGWIQGWQLTHPAEFPEFIPISLNLTPYLVARSVSYFFLIVGHLAFAISFAWMLVKKRAAAENARELFRPAPALRLETAS